MTVSADGPENSHEFSPHRRLSLWWDQLPEDLAGPPRPPLTEDLDVDVAIVGAGFTGLWTAYYLAKTDPSLNVVVIEAQTAGFGASGRNGGWASGLFPTSLSAVAKSSSRAAAVALTRAMYDTVDVVGAVAAEEGLDIHFRKGGTITAARTALQLERARAQVKDSRSWGFGPEDISLLNADEAREILDVTDLLGATYSPHCAAIHPARLVRGLAQVVERMGVRIYERTPATALTPHLVSTATGNVRARFLIRATEAWTSQLPGSSRDVLPLYSLMLATEPLSSEFWDSAGLARGQTFSDHRQLIIYGQRTADDRLAFGGRGAPYHLGSRISPAYERHAAASDMLRRTLVDLFPAVGKYAITHTWGGPLGVPRDWYPSVGLDPGTGMGWAGGYVGDGVASSNLAGRTLADLVRGRTTANTTLPWVNRRSRKWEPEPLRWIGANLALWVMTTTDHVEGRTGREPLRSKILGPFMGGH